MIWGGLLRLALVVFAALFEVSSCTSTLNPTKKNNEIGVPPIDILQQTIYSRPLSKNEHNYISLVERLVKDNVTRLKELNGVTSKRIDNASINCNRNDKYLSQPEANVRDLKEICKFRSNDIPGRNVFSKALDLLLNRNQIVKPVEKNVLHSNSNVDDDNTIKDLSLQQISNDYNNLLTNKITGFKNHTDDTSFSWVITDVSIITAEPFNYLANNSDTRTNKTSGVRLDRTNMVKKTVNGLDFKTLSPQSNNQKLEIYKSNNGAAASISNFRDLIVREDAILTHPELINVNDVISRPNFNLTESNKTIHDKNAKLLQNTVNKIESNNVSDSNNNSAQLSTYSTLIEQNHQNVSNGTSNNMNLDMKIQTVTDLTLSVTTNFIETAISSLFEVKKVKADSSVAENLLDNKQLTHSKIFVNNDYNVSGLFLNKNVSSNTSNPLLNQTMNHFTATTVLQSYSLNNFSNETNINNVLSNSTDVMQSNKNLTNLTINDVYISCNNIFGKNDKKSMVKYSKNEAVKNNFQNNLQAKSNYNSSTPCTNTLGCSIIVTNASQLPNPLTTTISPQLYMPVTPMQLSNQFSPKISLIFKPKQFVFSTDSQKETNNEVASSAVSASKPASEVIKSTLSLPFTPTTKSSSTVTTFTKTAINNSSETNNMKMVYTKYSSDVLFQSLYVGKTLSQEILQNTKETNYENHLKYPEDDQLNRRVYHQYTVFERHEENIPTIKKSATNLNNQLMFKLNNVVNNRNTSDNATSEKTTWIIENSSAAINYSSELGNTTMSMNKNNSDNLAATNAMIHSPLNIEITTTSFNESELINHHNKGGKSSARSFKEVARSNLQGVNFTNDNFNLTDKSNSDAWQTPTLVNDFHATSLNQINLVDFTTKISINQLDANTSKINDKLLIPIANDSISRLTNDSKSNNMAVKNTSNSISAALIDKKELIHPLIENKESSTRISLLRNKLLLRKVKLKKEFNDEIDEADSNPDSEIITEIIGMHPKAFNPNSNFMYMNSSSEINENKNNLGYMNTLLGKLLKPVKLCTTPYHGLCHTDSQYHQVSHNIKNMIKNVSQFSMVIGKENIYNKLNNSELLINDNLNNKKVLSSYLGESKYVVSTERVNNNASGAVRYNFIVESENNTKFLERHPDSEGRTDSKIKYHEISGTRLVTNNIAHYSISKDICNTTDKFRELPITDSINDLKTGNLTENLDSVQLVENMNNSKYIDISTEFSYLNAIDKVSNNIQTGIVNLKMNNKQKNKNSFYVEMGKPQLLTSISNVYKSPLVNITNGYDFDIINDQPLYKFTHNKSLTDPVKLNSVTPLNHFLHKTANLLSTPNNNGLKIQSHVLLPNVNESNVKIPLIKYEENGVTFNDTNPMKKSHISPIAQTTTVLHQNETLHVPENYRNVTETPLVSDNFFLEMGVTSTNRIIKNYKQAHTLSFDIHNNVKTNLLNDTSNQHLHLLPQFKKDNDTTLITTLNEYELGITSNKAMLIQSLNGVRNEQNIDSFGQTISAVTELVTSDGDNHVNNSVMDLPNLEHTALKFKDGNDQLSVDVKEFNGLKLNSSDISHTDFIFRNATNSDSTSNKTKLNRPLNGVRNKPSINSLGQTISAITELMTSESDDRVNMSVKQLPNEKNVEHTVMKFKEGNDQVSFDGKDSNYLKLNSTNTDVNRYSNNSYGNISHSESIFLNGTNNRTKLIQPLNGVRVT